jgi:GPI mannosyltransferase 3
LSFTQIRIELSENTGFLWIVGLLTYIRPTSAITWLPICIHHIQKSRYTVWELLIKRYLFIGVLLGGFLVALDSYFHGSLIITPWEFFKVNVLNGIGSFYGSHPFYWYFSSGLPAILGIGIVPFYLAIFSAMKSWNEAGDRQVILKSIIFTIFAFSLLPHKEFRFLLQLLPLCLYVISHFLSEWSRTKSTIVIWFTVIVIFVANAVPAGYLGYVHQQGTLKVMDKIHDIAVNYKTQEGKAPKIFFMMPCHSTPFYSHVHANVSMRFLTCEPSFENQENYLDEADKFYEAPMKWIRANLPVHPVDALPSHVVIFDTLASKISDFLSIYKPLEPIYFHSDHLVSSRGGRNVIIFERVDTTHKPQAQQKKPPADKPKQQEEL